MNEDEIEAYGIIIAVLFAILAISASALAGIFFGVGIGLLVFVVFVVFAIVVFCYALLRAAGNGR